MSRPGKRKVQSRKASDAALEKKKSLILRGLRAALAAILAGIPFTCLAVVSYILGVDPPSRYFFNIGVKAMTNALINEAKDSASYYLNLMEPNGVASFDASWSHKRNAKLCIADVIDIKQQKIVSFAIVDKLLEDPGKNYDGPSNLMESYGFEKIIKELKESGKIGTLVKDGDTKIDKIIEKYNWTVNLVSDINHKFKNFHSSFERINHKYNNSLKGIENRVKSWLGEVLFSNHTIDEKIRIWKNTLNHFLGNHQNCMQHGTVKPWKNAKNPIAIQALQEVIQFWLPTVSEFIRGETTNYNEAFHSIKARYFNKNYNYGETSIARICASICQYNEGYKWF